MTGLHLACHEGHIEIVTELIKHDASLNKCNNDGFNSFFIACLAGQVGVLKELRKHISSIDLQSVNGCSPLITASQHGRLNTVKELLHWKETDIDYCDNDGCTALYFACEQGNTAVVRILMNHSANLNKFSHTRTSPLIIASSNGHYKVVRELLKSTKIDIDHCNVNGVTALLIACEEGYIKIVEKLIESFAGVNKPAQDFPVYIFAASQKGYIDIRNVSGGLSPLHKACQKNHIEVVRELLKSEKLDINYRDMGGRTALYFACFCGFLGILKELICRGADVNIPDKTMKTPLYIATLTQNKEAVLVLLKNNADKNALDTEFKSPLDIASENSIDDIKVILENWENTDI